MVSYCQFLNIKKLISTGSCKSCAKHNITGLEIGHGWNKGIKGYGKWPKWFPKDEYNPAWKGGITSKDKLFRKSKEYKEWRKSVFERDNYTCVECGQVGGKLHADHIKPFAYFKEERLSLPNGRTLCISCHKKTDTYLSGALKYALSI
jgi:hypothetical protein